MSPLTFVLPVLAAFVLVSVGLILRAFLRVRGEPILLDALPDVPVSPAVQPAAPVAAESRDRLPGISLDREALATLTRWYSGRQCAICTKDIGLVNRTEPRPGLLSAAAPASEIMTWDKIPPDHLKAVLDSHLPVCSSCVLAASFRRSFPERVTDRTDTTARDRAYH